MKTPLILVYKVYSIQNDRLDLTINGLENAVPYKSVKFKKLRKIVNMAMMHCFSNWLKLINHEIKMVVLNTINPINSKEWVTTI